MCMCTSVCMYVYIYVCVMCACVPQYVLGLCRYIDKPICTGFCSTIRFGYRFRVVSIQREATQTKILKNSNLGILLLYIYISSA